MHCKKAKKGREFLLWFSGFLFLILVISFASAQACPKTWTSQFDWDSGIKENVDSSSVPGSLILKKADPTIVWHFDEGGGRIAHSSGNLDVNGNIYGDTIWTAGISGTALDFSGTYSLTEDRSDPNNPPKYIPTYTITGGVSTSAFVQRASPSSDFSVSLSFYPKVLLSTNNTAWFKYWNGENYSTANYG